MSLVKNLAGQTQEIIEYLHNHPDFFRRHPEVLSELNIPHQTESNVASLIEYQVAQLRLQTNDLQHTIHDLEKDATSKRKLAENIHTLSLCLLKADDYKILYKILYNELKKYYSADQVLLLIFNKNKLKKDFAGLKFLDSNSGLDFMFTEIFHRNKPLCDSLQQEQIDALFDKHEDAIHSTVLIPIQQSNWHGLFVIGSQERNYYSHGFEMDLLFYLSNILKPIINSWFK
ncbi:MAG: DUF484 family protein [Gammaproteobacteria bacterium]